MNNTNKPGFYRQKEILIYGDDEDYDFKLCAASMVIARKLHSRLKNGL